MGTLKGITTYGITLEWGSDLDSLEEVLAIKNVPALGGPPQLVDITTFKDKVRSYLSGTQNINALEFTSNFTEDDFITVNSVAGDPLYYVLKYGDEGSEGAYMWQGSHVCWPDGGTVDSPVDLIISVAPTTAPALYTPDVGTESTEYTEEEYI